MLKMIGLIAGIGTKNVFCEILLFVKTDNYDFS